MNKILRMQSSAKINLHLDIGDCAGADFHPLTSIFHLCSLSDFITITINKQQEELIQLEMEGGPTIAPELNLAWKAAKLFFKLSGNHFPVRIQIKKRIPDGAGLGGGSSNAASVLAGLNFMAGYPVPFDLLFKQSASLGSDVPFFLKNSAAHVKGRGEVVTPIASLVGIPIIIIVPPISINTGFAFTALDREKAFSKTINHGFLQEYFEGSPDSWSFFNSFQPLMTTKYPDIQRALNLLIDENSVFSSMSGSGSAVFGLFLSNEAAQKAEKRLKKEFKAVYREKLIEKFQNWL